MYSTFYQSNRDRSCSPQRIYSSYDAPSKPSLVRRNLMKDSYFDTRVSSSVSRNEVYPIRNNYVKSSISSVSDYDRNSHKSDFYKHISSTNRRYRSMSRELHDTFSETNSPLQARCRSASISTALTFGLKSMKIEPEKYPNGCLKNTSLFVKGESLHLGKPDYGYLGPEHFINAEEVWHYYYKYVADEADYIFDKEEYFERATSNNVICAPTGFTYGYEKHWPDGRVPVPHMSFFTPRDQQLVFEELDRMFRRKYPTVVSPFCKEYLEEVDRNNIRSVHNIQKISSVTSFEEKKFTKVKAFRKIGGSLREFFPSMILLLRQFYCFLSNSLRKCTNLVSWILSALIILLCQCFSMLISKIYCCASRLFAYSSSNILFIASSITSHGYNSSNSAVRGLTYLFQKTTMILFIPFMLVTKLLIILLEKTLSGIIHFLNVLSPLRLLTNFFGVLQKLMNCFGNTIISFSRHFVEKIIRLKNVFNISSMTGYSEDFSGSNGNVASTESDMEKLIKLQNNLNSAYENISRNHKVEKVDEKRRNWCCLLPLLLFLFLLPFCGFYFKDGAENFVVQVPNADCKMCEKVMDIKMQKLEDRLMQEVNNVMFSNQHSEESTNKQEFNLEFSQFVNRLEKLEELYVKFNQSMNENMEKKISNFKEEFDLLFEKYTLQTNTYVENKQAEYAKSNEELSMMQTQIKTEIINLLENKLHSQSVSLNDQLKLQLDKLEKKMEVHELKLNDQISVLKQLLQQAVDEAKTEFKKSLGEKDDALRTELDLKMKKELLQLKKTIENVLQKEITLQISSFQSKHLPDNFKEQLTVDIMSRVWQKIPKKCDDSSPTHSSFQDMKTEINQMIAVAIALYDSDKTGKPDFALKSAGGSVHSTPCTETYLSSVLHLSLFESLFTKSTSSIDKIIEPSVNPGDCWPFAGASGTIILKLSKSIYVSGISIEHVPKRLSHDGKIESAPKEFTVSGMPYPEKEGTFIFGSFMYDKDGDPLQHFDAAISPEKFQFVKVAITSNWGHMDYTCVYRIRVHGNP